MPATTTTFLTQISIDPKSSIKFHRNPQATIDSAPLSKEGKVALLTKDPGKIRDVILKEKGVIPGKGVTVAGDIEVVLVIVI